MDEEEDVSLSSMEMETEKRPLPLFCIDIMDYLWYIYYVLNSSIILPKCDLLTERRKHYDHSGDERKKERTRAVQ